MKEYDADQITVSFAGITVKGYADGEFVTVEQETDDFSDVVGTDSEVTRSKTGDRRATIKFMLMQSSETNKLLSAINQADKDNPNGAGVGALTIRDRQGTSLYRWAEAWIQRPPNVSFDRKAGPREWTLRGANTNRTDGGN